MVLRQTRNIHFYLLLAATISTGALFIAVYRLSTSDVRHVVPSNKMQKSVFSTPPQRLLKDFTPIAPAKNMPKSASSAPRQEIQKDARPAEPRKEIRKSVSSTPPQKVQQVEEQMKSFQLNGSSFAWRLTNLWRLANLEDRPDFQNVSEVGSILYVHAALWKEKNVRISLIKKTRVDETNILCILWYSSDNQSNFSIVKATVQDLQNYGKAVGNGYLKCPIETNNAARQIHTAPFYVGLIHEENLEAGPRIILPVENRHINSAASFEDNAVPTGKTIDTLLEFKKSINVTTNNRQRHGHEKGRDKTRMVEFTVCIPAIFNYHNAAQLVEKFEMVRLLGAERIVVYVNYVKPNVDTVLNMYTKAWAAGLETLEVVVHSWKVPPVKLHYMGQAGTIDDCLHRYALISRYIAFDDLDELMIPLRHANWSELIAERSRLRPNSAAFMFRCSIMNKDHLSEAAGFQKEASLFGSAVFSLTQRDNFIWPPRQRSKIIVDPRKVDAGGVHHIYRGDGPTDIIPTDLGLLYHYRWPIRLCQKEVKDERVVTKFGQRLALALKSVWAKLKNVKLGWIRPDPISNNTTRPSCIIQARHMENARKRRLKLEEQKQKEAQKSKEIPKSKKVKKPGAHDEKAGKGKKQ